MLRAPDSDDVIRAWGTLPLETPLCDHCASAQRSHLATEQFAGYTFGVVKCLRCGLSYSCPRPSAQLRQHLHTPAIRNALVEAGLIAQRHRIREGIPTIFAWDSQTVHLPNYRRGLRLLANHGASGRLLDVGCAGGRFVQMAQEAGFPAAGCDIMTEQVRYGREELGLDLVAGHLEDLGFADGQFDVITLWDVLEHVPSPSAILREIARILRPGGYLLVQSPNFALCELRLRLGWRHSPDRYGLFSFEHIYHFTPRTLTNSLRSEGLREVRYLVDTDDGNRGARMRIRRAITRGVYHATHGTLNWHAPLLALAVR